jgi:hypothetical protein
MSGHTTTRTTMPTTTEAFFADRQRIWDKFTSAAFWGVVFVTLLLLAMAVFLL